MSTCPTELNVNTVQVAPANTTIDFPEFDDATAAGDWGLFRRRCTFIASNPAIGEVDSTVLKRRFALAYLGQRAQMAGGVYLRSRPSVFTPALIEQLAQENTAARFTRYPWLERLMQLLQQLDSDQYGADTQHGSVVTLSKPRHKLQVVPNAFA